MVSTKLFGVRESVNRSVEAKKKEEEKEERRKGEGREEAQPPRASYMPSELARKPGPQNVSSSIQAWLPRGSEALAERTHYKK